MTRTSRILLVLACCAALAILGVILVRNLVDFPVYYAAGRSLLHGRSDLYSPDFALGPVMDYRYPPFFLVVLLPIWFVPYLLSAYLWYLLSVIEVIGSVLIVSRTFPRFRESKLMCGLVTLGVSQYFLMALHYGNAHVLAVFLWFASLYFVLRRRSIAAALVLSLSISIKLTPIFLLPYLALRKHWGMLASTGCLLIAINLSPSIYLGFRRNIELLGTWYEHVVASQSFHEDNGPINLSLKGQLRRYLSTVDYSQRVDGDVRYPSINLSALAPERLVGAWTFLGAGLFAA